MKNLLIILFLIFISLSCSSKICSKIIVINDTGIWTDFDQKTLEAAKVRCGQLYKNSPCLKLFKKIEDKTYSAICGGYEK